jgi:hypothetical protein
MGRSRRVYEKMRSSYKVLIEKSEENQSVGRHRSRWMYNIKTYLSKMGLGNVDWIHQALNRDLGIETLGTTKCK